MVTRKTRILAILGAIACCVAMVSCGGKTESTAAKSKGIKIGYVMAAQTNQGILIINQGAKQAAEDSGVQLRVATFPMNDYSGYANAMDDLVSQGAKVIVTAYGGKQTDEAIKRAVASKVPVVTIDSKPNLEEVSCHVGIDNYEAAKLGAEWMAKALDGKGTVAMLNGMQSIKTGQDRRNGFYDTIVKDYPNIKLFEVATEFNQEKALAGMEDALTALGHVDGVYCAWDGGTMSAMAVLEQSGVLNQVKLLGFDGAADALQAMKAGKVTADVAQPLYEMGYQGVIQALKIANGESVPKEVNVGTKVITPSNVDEWIDSAHLKEFLK